MPVKIDISLDGFKGLALGEDHIVPDSLDHDCALLFAMDVAMQATKTRGH